ncbi:MAG: hypothetical protein ACOYVK_11825 [Bacillota bacterium]
MKKREEHGIDKRYIRIGKESGCISAKYSMTNDDEENIIIPYERNEESGRFRNIKKYSN